MIEKRNIIEDGRTPMTTEKTAEVVDEGAALFKPAADITTAETKKMPVINQTQEDTVDAGKTVNR
jgi:hypothetical protein